MGIPSLTTAVWRSHLPDFEYITASPDLYNFKVTWTYKPQRKIVVPVNKTLLRRRQEERTRWTGVSSLLSVIDKVSIEIDSENK